MRLSPSFFAHQTEALQFWSCPTSVLIFRDPTPPKSAGEPVQQAQAHPTSLKFRMPGAKVQHHPANLWFSPFFSTNAQGDAATDWRHIAPTRGTRRPQSTQQASAIRPEASSNKTMTWRHVAATTAPLLVHLQGSPLNFLCGSSSLAYVCDGAAQWPQLN